MTESDPFVQPILKWVGGKRQLAEVIKPMIRKCSTYYEPFVGGGAILFHMQPKKAIINDSNEQLMNVYEVIKTDPALLVQKLVEHKEKNCEKYFYEIRALDRDPDRFQEMSNIEKAARMIYLNKTCYNGLFRVNSAGEFNAPWGKYKNPNITNETTIDALNRYFNKNNINLMCKDYQEALKGIRKGAFVYFDPPYMPISSSSSFTGYTANGFGEKEQIALKKQCDKLNKKNINFLLSNSSCEFIEDLYQDYIVEKVSAKRAINVKPDKRGAIDEVLIRNYELD